MRKLSTLRKLRVAAQVAQEQAGRSRTLNALLSGAKTTARSFGRASHQLWLEVTGTVFLSMALFGAVALVREYAKYAAAPSPNGRERLAVIICFTLAFAWFGLSSFLRVRKKSQQQ